jgi:uncharacterized protein (TIGR01777 family)
MKVIITGSHGLIGSELSATLRQRGHHVTRLVRSDPSPGDAVWNIGRGTIDRAALEGHDAVVNLAGAGLGERRWTEAYKREIRDSRVRGTELLCGALAELERPPRVLVSGSAVGYYGDRGDEELTEASRAGTGFLAEVVADWESATKAADAAGIRVVRLRTGVVLSPKGGALKRQLTPFRLGLGGQLGSGRQWLSWISLDDLVEAMLHLIHTETVRGAVNATAPNPVTNAEFTKALGAALHRPAILPVPTVALKVMFGGDMVREMLLAGQRVLPRALQAIAFPFRQPTVGEALRSMLAA